MSIVGDLRALHRSWRIYFSNPDHDRKLDGLYARYIKPGDLVFDIGAHVGHRTASFRRLGARVIAVEPQFLPATLIRIVQGLRGDVKVIRAACGPVEGTAKLHVNSDNPIVSTMSGGFIQASRGARGWEGQSWDRTISVPMVSIDSLAKIYGAPAFVKIDIEGFEREALAGLTRTVPALSFEFTTIQKAVGVECIERCAELGFAGFNAVIGETHDLAFESPVSATEIRQWLEALPVEENSGDIYATRY